MTMNAKTRSTASHADVLQLLPEGELLDLVLARNENAWREFVRRYDGVLRGCARKTMDKAMQSILDSDAIDDVLGDFYLSLVDNDMRKLRRWANGSRKAKLETWLVMIVCGIAIDHIRRAFSEWRAVDAATAQHVAAERESDARRGADWIVAERAERHHVDPTMEPKKKRKRKSRNDIV
jgi:DNA-directed RNA polymerase specialized sigma24 family protein